MSSEDLAGRLSHQLVGIIAEFLKRAENASLVDRWRSIAKHVNNRAADVWIGVVGHLEEPIPNPRIMQLNFARTQSLNSFAPYFGIAVSAQFEQARNF